MTKPNAVSLPPEVMFKMPSSTRTPTAAQLMDLNMLAVLFGCERTQSEYATLFRDAGLQLTSATQTHSPFQIVEATAASQEGTER